MWHFTSLHLSSPRFTCDADENSLHEMIHEMQERVGSTMTAAPVAGREARPSGLSALLVLAIPLWWAVVAAVWVGGVTGWW